MKETSRKVTKRISYVALFTALICVCTWAAIPMPSGISVTLQTFAVMLAGALLGWKYGTAAIISYIAIGCTGVPVFSGFRGGIGVLAGPTGGYIAGFVFLVLCVGLACEFFGVNPVVLAVSMAVGVLICYAFGTVWFTIYSEKSFEAALALCVFPYIPFDAVKIALAAFLAPKLKKHIDL